jgi:DNA polymerase III epsilon subunit-like protein
MRQIVLDTETTGLEPQLGHRIIEIGCVELVNRKLTGRHYHQYINRWRVLGVYSRRRVGDSQRGVRYWIP